PIFQRYPWPEKEYQSFSLIYSDRSLDVSSHSRNDEIPSEANSPRIYTQRSSPLHSLFGSGNSSQKDIIDQLSLHSPYGSPPKNGQKKTFPDAMLYKLPLKSFYPPIHVNGSVNGHDDGDALGDVFIWFTNNIFCCLCLDTL
ncbi:hypothetical protein Tco_1296926, partial [Tanacetum coccineum]